MSLWPARAIVRSKTRFGTRSRSASVRSAGTISSRSAAKIATGTSTFSSAAAASISCSKNGPIGSHGIHRLGDRLQRIERRDQDQAVELALGRELGGDPLPMLKPTAIDRASASPRSTATS